MMNKKALIVSIAILLSLAPSVSAQTPLPTKSPKVINERLMERREALLQKKLAFQQNREEFKEKLSLLRDEGKKLIVESIDEKLAMINKNRTDQMTKSLDQMSKLLDKFATRASALNQNGQNTTEFDNQLTEAESAITAARTAVAEQAGKDYAADISDESTLKSNVGQAMKTLQQDLKATHEIVKAAKKEVMDAARAVAKLKKTNLTPSVTNTLTPTVTSTLTPTLTP